MKVKEKKLFSILFFFFFLLSHGIAFTEEPVAERPSYSEGDYWVFINRNKFKEFTHTFLREEKDKYIFSLNGSDKTTHFYFTSDLERHPVGYPGPIIDFPLAVGKKWEYEFQSKGGRDRKKAQHRVETYEFVEVPAGKFQAFKITVHREAVDWSKKITMPTSEYYWYNPEVKQLIKRINAKGDIWELKEYKIK